MLPESELARIRRATGLDLTAERVAAICALQDGEQSGQFGRDCAAAVLVHEARLAGESQDGDAEIYSQACHRIAWWWMIEEMINGSRKGRKHSALVSKTMRRLLDANRGG